MMKAIGFTLLLSLAWSFGFSQKAGDFKSFNPRFEVFELPGGTLGNSVQCIVQDSMGFLWFGSSDGLHRYDGQNIRTIRHDPSNPKSIASNHIEYIFLDSRGLLWLTHWTSGGLTCLNPATETAVRYRHDPNDPASLGNNTNSVVVEDREGYIWVGGNGGLDRLDRKTGKFKHFRHNPADPRSLSYDKVRALYVDRQGTLWVGTGYVDETQNNLGGLNRYDPKTESFSRYLNEPGNPNSLASNKVRAMFEDSKSNFWVGTSGDGLHQMNREKGTFTRVQGNPRTIGAQSANPGKPRPPFLRNLPPDFFHRLYHISAILEDRNGRIWILAPEGGLNVFDPSSGIVRHFEKEVGEGNLTTNSLWQIYQSRDGMIWISGGGGGRTVFKVNLQSNLFSYFLTPGRSEDLHGIVKDRQGNIWLGYDSGVPLARFNRSTGVWTNFPADPSPGGFTAKMVWGLSLDRDGFVWIGTDNGIFRHDPRTGKFRHYLSAAETGSPEFLLFGAAPCGRMLHDRNGNYWVVTWGNGLFKLDPASGKFTQYKHRPGDPKSISGNNVSGLNMDAAGNIWAFGGHYGHDPKYPLYIDRLAPGRGNQVEFAHFTENALGVVIDLADDPAGNIWFIDSYYSLKKLNPAQRSFRSYLPKNIASPLSSLASLAKGKDGSIWITQADAILHFDPHTGKIVSFNASHGVRCKGMVFGSLSIAEDGEVFFGDVSGFHAFYPEQLFLAETNQPPIVRITSFHLDEGQAMPGDTRAFQDVLEKPVWLSSQLHLAYNQNIFSFSAACLDFSDPAANQLQFMLEGYDKGWRKDLRNGETPSYVNVPPGAYTFRVRGANSLGVWNMDGASIKITIAPPWWKTWWAYTIYGLLALTGILLFDRYQRRRITQRERQRALEREVAQAKEIEKAYAELGVAHENLKATQSQLIQSEKLASLGELTAGIAHEIQNPLNFVNNFSELSVELAKELKDEIKKPEKDWELIDDLTNDLTQNQEKIHHHGKRASAIVTGMLQHARTSTGAKEPTDLNALADEYLRLAYHGLRAKDSNFNANMVTDFDPAIGKVEVIPQDIGRVFLNIISNAFYAVSQRALVGAPLAGAHEGRPYEPTVTVSSKRTEKGVEFRIQDNGTGIPDDVKARIFQPFFTTKPTGQGTGLGLSLAYDIVVKGHGGTLEVESVEGLETAFTIRIPG